MRFINTISTALIFGFWQRDILAGCFMCALLLTLIAIRDRT